MNRRLLLILIGFLLAALLLWLGWVLFLQSPASGLGKAQASLIAAVESRDWDEVKEWLAAEYADEPGFDREQAVRAGAEALRGFISLTVEAETVSLAAGPEQGAVSQRIRISGNGAGFSESVKSAVNGLREPWVFKWRKQGRWPWDWRVTSIDNEELGQVQLPEGF